MTRTPLLLVPGVLCSPRLFATQVAALSNQADIVVPDWRTAPLSIWDSWASAARWVVDQMPAEKFALAGLSLGGMLAVEIMQFASDRVTKLALLDTGMRSQSEAERAIRRARIRLANEGHFELVLGMQMTRFIPAYRLPDKPLVDEVMTMCGEIGVEIYKRQEELAAIRTDRRPDLPGIKCPTIVVLRPRRRGNALVPVRGDRQGDPGRRARGGRPVRPSRHDGKAGGGQPDSEDLAGQVRSLPS
jgi:pimeloyl-ACP methyl ester carboxylesterase